MKEEPKLKTSEFQEQCAFFDWVDWKALKDPRFLNIMSVSNESGKGIQNLLRTKKLRKSGLKKGFPDIGVYIPIAPYHGMFIEMKVKPNKPKEDQLEWMRRLHSMNYHCVVCYSAEEAIRALTKYLESHG